ncbi:MAG: response regulator transcription factor [Pseudomonadota bacterium]
MSLYRIVLADDHPMFRQGIKTIIEKTSDIKVVGEAGDGLKLLEMIKNLLPDMVILDISMPYLRGIEATKEVKRISENIKVLILTMHKKKEYLYYAISAGADGYILKEEAIIELFSAIKTIRKGSNYISPSLNSELTHDLIRFQQGEQVDGLMEPLSVREKEVLMLIAEGMSNKEIANLLNISINTVQNHRSNIKKKLNAKKTANLVRYAVSKGYI